MIHLKVIKPSSLLVGEVVQVIGSEASVLRSLRRRSVHLAGRLGRSLGSMRVLGHEAVLVDLTRKEAEECLLLVLGATPLGIVPLDGLLLLALGHLEEHVEESERGKDENQEEVKDFEGEVFLLLEVDLWGFLVGAASGNCRIDLLNDLGLLLLEAVDQVCGLLNFLLDLLSMLGGVKGRWVNILMSNRDLLAILGALGCGSVPSLRVQLPLKDGATLGINLVGLDSNLLINGIKMYSNVGECPRLLLAKDISESSDLVQAFQNIGKLLGGSHLIEFVPSLLLGQVSLVP